MTGICIVLMLTFPLVGSSMREILRCARDDKLWGVRNPADYPSFLGRSCRLFTPDIFQPSTFNSHRRSGVSPRLPPVLPTSFPPSACSAFSAVNQSSYFFSRAAFTAA